MRQLLVFILILALVFLTATSVSAKSSQLPGLTEKLTEKITLSFKRAPQAKFDYYLILLTKRLTEIELVITTNNLYYLEQTSSRYSTYIAIFTDLITKYSLSSQNASALQELYSTHTSKLLALQTHYPANSSFWMLVQHDINSLKISQDRLGLK